MVKITKEYLIKHSDGLKMKPLRLKTDSDEDFLKRVTHLKLQGRYVEHLDNLKCCNNITFLYLQNNILQTIHGLDNFSKLTHLYLQRNKIAKIENLSCLANLRKLYIGYNEISVIEGLENLNVLRELHLEYQNLPLGETVYFDPRSVQNLSGCLQILNTSGNGLISLSPLMNMQSLTELTATENKLADLEDLCRMLTTLPELFSIKLTGNPVELQRYFKDAVILSSPNLKFLDDIDIPPTARKFLQGWKRAKATQSRGAPETKKSLEYSQSLTRKVHFSQIPARNNIPAKPLTFEPWKLRKSVSIDGKLSPMLSRMHIRRRLEETFES